MINLAAAFTINHIFSIFLIVRFGISVSFRYFGIVSVNLGTAHNLCFEQKYENISFLSETFQFLEVKFSIYLNRCVFGMNA